MRRDQQRRATVGQMRAEQKSASVGACSGCNNHPASCVCHPVGPPGTGSGGFLFPATPAYGQATLVMPNGNGTVPPSAPPGSPGNPAGSQPGLGAFTAVGPTSMMLASASMFPSKLMPGGNIATAYDWYWQQIRSFQYPCVPYEDAIRDCLLMTDLTSGDPVTIAAGASALLTIGPTRGWFDAFYFSINALDPATATTVDPSSYRLTPPQVADCPQPCDTTAMRAIYMSDLEGCCCGRPFRAIIGRDADGEALTFTVTNDGLAAITVQARVRGWCHARSLCI